MNNPDLKTELQNLQIMKRAVLKARARVWPSRIKGWRAKPMSLKCWNFYYPARSTQCPQKM